MSCIIKGLATPWGKGGLALIALAIILFGLDRCAKRLVDGVVHTSTEAGRQQERANSAETTIIRTQEADNAAETVRHNDVARHAECLRHARNPKDC